MQTLTDNLEQDHDLIRTLINYIRADDLSVTQKKKHFEKFSTLLLNHIKSEESAVYTPSKALKGPCIQRLVQNGLQQHFLIKNSIAKIKNCKEEKAWASEFTALSALLDHHLGEEECELFPELSRNFSKEQLASVSENYVAMKSDYK